MEHHVEPYTLKKESLHEWDDSLQLFTVLHSMSENSVTFNGMMSNWPKILVNVSFYTYGSHGGSLFFGRNQVPLTDPVGRTQFLYRWTPILCVKLDSCRKKWASVASLTPHICDVQPITKLGMSNALRGLKRPQKTVVRLKQFLEYIQFS